MVRKIFNNIGSILGLLAGAIIFYTGISRISTGINSIRLSDSYVAHFMNVGIIYIYISLLILLAFTIKITYSLGKK